MVDISILPMVLLTNKHNWGSSTYSMFFFRITSELSFTVSFMVLEEIAFLVDEVFGTRSPLNSVLQIENIMRSCRSTEQP